MSLSEVFERFGKDSTPCVMARAVLERVFGDSALDDFFAKVAKRGYTRSLLFSSVVDLMLLVACRIRPSVHSAYQGMPGIGASIRAFYDKLRCMGPEVSEGLVRLSGKEMRPLVMELSPNEEWLAGYRARVLDGNCLEATEHRLKPLRAIAAGPLPGKSLVVFDAVTGLVTDVFCTEDGHAQERSILPRVSEIVAENDLWIADRNFCVSWFLNDLKQKGACFIIRRHASLPGEAIGERRCCGAIETGEVYEQAYSLGETEDGQPNLFRLVTVELNNDTRGGDKNLYLMTNLPESKAPATKVAELYKRRWTIENAFAEIKKSLNAEINTLGYPGAALFSFCVALVAFNVLAVIKAALRREHGAEKIDNELSNYRVAEEITGTWRGMEIAIPEQDWQQIRAMPLSEFIALLRRLASQIQLRHYKKSPRGPKKPAVKRTKMKNQTHVSTAKILKERKSLPK